MESLAVMLGYIGFKIGAGWLYWLCYILWLVAQLAEEARECK